MTDYDRHLINAEKDHENEPSPELVKAEQRIEDLEAELAALNGHLGEAIHVLRRVVAGHDEAVAAQVCLDGIDAGEALEMAGLIAERDEYKAAMSAQRERA